MRHDETPLQVFTAHPSGVPTPVVRGMRRREPTIPFRSAELPPSEPPPAAEPPAPGWSEAHRALSEAPTWIFETHAPAAVAAPVAVPGVGVAAPSAFDAAPARYWRTMEDAYDRPLRRLWRSVLRLLGIERG